MGHAPTEAGIAPTNAELAPKGMQVATSANSTSFKPGWAGGPGRPKGSKNVKRVDLSQMIMMVRYALATK
jgi:hypothetical protein